jgi:insertion element IS1 protein InsB
VLTYCLDLECDELWSFCWSKDTPIWLWIAMEAGTRKILAVHFGDRSQESALALWEKIPDRYAENVLCYTDEWDSYGAVLPPENHCPSPKGSGKTSLIERFNNTLRQRCSRLVRKTLSFSKKVSRHIAHITLFICHYNTRMYNCSQHA